MAPAADARCLRLPLDPDILVGHAGMDDAAVHRICEDLAVVASVGFVTPMVDAGPEVLGAIMRGGASVAAAHACPARPG